MPYGNPHLLKLANQSKPRGNNPCTNKLSNGRLPRHHLHLFAPSFSTTIAAPQHHHRDAIFFFPRAFSHFTRSFHLHHCTCNARATTISTQELQQCRHHKSRTTMETSAHHHQQIHACTTSSAIQATAATTTAASPPSSNKSRVGIHLCRKRSTSPEQPRRHKGGRRVRE